MSDPEFMAYNAGWTIGYPGYDRETGCIEWPESEWEVFAERLALPGGRQGYFHVRDTRAGTFVGHAHDTVELDGAAHLRLNIVPARRGRGLGGQVLQLLVERIWPQTAVEEVVNELDDGRVAAVSTHRTCGLEPDPGTHADWGRPTRTWRLRGSSTTRLRLSAGSRLGVGSDTLARRGHGSPLGARTSRERARGPRHEHRQQPQADHGAPRTSVRAQVVSPD